MNLVHRWLCRSAAWQTKVERVILPWVLKDVSLGANVLEIGPGFGATTDVIQRSVQRLTCIEVDRDLAGALRRKIGGRNVTVVCGDASAMSLKPSTFDSVVCFTMLHHVPSVESQDRMLEEAARVLRPGGLFCGTDNLGSWPFRVFHLFDTMVLVNPDTFAERLRTAGFIDISIDVDKSASRFRFRARKAAAA